MTNYDSHNFSDLTLSTQRALIALITGFYSGAHHFAIRNNIPVQIAELEFAKTCVSFSYSLSEEVITELAESIDRHQIYLFSDEMAQRIRDLAKTQETAPTSHDDKDDDNDGDDEDFSFVDEDDLIDYLNDYSNIGDIDAGEADV